MSLLKGLYISLRFFKIAGIILALIILSYSFPVLFMTGKILLLLLLAATLADIIVLFHPKLKISCSRSLSKILSLGTENQVKIMVKNFYSLPLRASLIDELPYQLQERNLSFELTLPSGKEMTLSYKLRPVTRGEYLFGKVHLFVSSKAGLIQRKVSFNEEQLIKVYPSVAEMKNFELMAFPKVSHFHGIKKMRRLGHSYEFEKIRNYVEGDDFRSINWKATGRKGSLMVNQYEDEKAQQVFSVIDKSRAMKMPFHNLSLLDYAINSSLVISNIALHKQDRSGLITFAEKVHTVVKPEKSREHLKAILETLYNEKQRETEANFEALYLAIKSQVKGRSLILLYTNFESYYAAERILPVLRKINRNHLLVVIFFENSEIVEFSKNSPAKLEDIYHQTIAQKFLAEKNKIVFQLRQWGIQTIYTRPEDLSVNTVNKYLELKSRGMI